MRVLQVSHNKWVIEHQLAGSRRMAIAFFGDGQGDNRDLRFTHFCQHGFQTIDLGVQRFFDDAHHAGSPCIRGHFCHGV